MPHRGGLSADTVRTACAFNNALELLVAKSETEPLDSGWPILFESDDSLVPSFLHVACYRGMSPELVRALIHAGALVNRWDSQGFRPLDIVIYNWQVEIDCVILESKNYPTSLEPTYTGNSFASSHIYLVTGMLDEKF